MVLAGLFLGTLGVINLLGLSRFIDVSFSIGSLSIPLSLPLGVLPYPITFLCTDIISEFYGKKRANLVVWIGFFINLWILLILWLGGTLPPTPENFQGHLPDVSHPEYAFFKIRLLTMGGIFGSMLAYLIAQFLDVYLFHFWKDVTKGKHLWLRNNASTLVSQFVDTFIVILFAYYFTQSLPLSPDISHTSQLTSLIFSSYAFKAIAALISTFPFYLAVFWLRRYFAEKHDAASSFLPA